MINTLLLILSIALVLDCIFTGTIRKALAPVNGAMINALAVVLVFDSSIWRYQRNRSMKKIALTLALLSLSVYADTHVYECEMAVAEVKNDVIRNVVKANYGAMVVDSGEQFYVVRDDRVLSSPYLIKRNGKLSGVGEDKFIYNKSGDVYGVHAKNASYLFDDSKEVG
ncbi:hypothetical protein OFY05_23215 (plasmid) [Pseudocitrobacter faecalis]|nr:hypothetical protein OFY05_23215 [Pseudocitrobacter faecalis]